MKQVYWLLIRSFVLCVLAYALYGSLIIYAAQISSRFSGALYSRDPATTILMAGISALLFITLSSLLNAHIVEKLRSALLQAAVLDNPNNRSMHTIPTPRGAGWGFVLPVTGLLISFSGLILYYAFSEAPADGVSGCIMTATDAFGRFTNNCGRNGYDGWMAGILLLGGLMLLTIISWTDDRKGVAARWRLLAQLAAVFIAYLAIIFPAPDLMMNAAFYAQGFRHLPHFLPTWLIIAVLSIIWVGFINLYNFMDGIDGITATETISLTLGLLITTILIGEISHQLTPSPLAGPAFLYLGALLGCSIGFLRFNWHPAKIFLGDVGSVTIGYLMGFCLIAVVSAGYWYVAATLPLYYLADGGITLLRRLFKGEKIWEAHRTHFYQRAAQAAGRHDVVVLKIAACNAVLTVIAVLELLYSPWLVLAAPLPVALLLYNMTHQRHIGPKQVTGTPSVR